MYNPTSEIIDLKTILKKINLGEEIFTQFMKENEIKYIKNNVVNIKFYKGNDNSEIVFIKKKVYGTKEETTQMLMEVLKCIELQEKIESLLIIMYE